MKIPKGLKLPKYNKNFKNDSGSGIFTKNIVTPNAACSRIINPILGLNRLPKHIFRNDSNSRKKLKKNISMPIPDLKEVKESKERTEKLNLLQNYPYFTYYVSY